MCGKILNPMLEIIQCIVMTLELEQIYAKIEHDYMHPGVPTITGDQCFLTLWMKVSESYRIKTLKHGSNNF